MVNLVRLICHNDIDIGHCDLVYISNLNLRPLINNLRVLRFMVFVVEIGHGARLILVLVGVIVDALKVLVRLVQADYVHVVVVVLAVVHYRFVHRRNGCQTLDTILLEHNIIYIGLIINGFFINGLFIGNTCFVYAGDYFHWRR